MRNLRFISILLVFLSAVAMSDETEPAAALNYECEESWQGPMINLRGVALPLPVGYGLVDRSVGPHEFSNLGQAMELMPIGRIMAGSAPGYVVGRAIDDKEFSRQVFTWGSATREILTYHETGHVLDLFIFDDDVILQFVGAALDYAEAVASCYEELLVRTVRGPASRKEAEALESKSGPKELIRIEVPVGPD